ncbi:MAG: AMP-binding protein [Planctomycetes bacterium]|nr:AMP-binding protein [Planctomycetota bacterium]
MMNDLGEWVPDPGFVASSNIGWLLRETGFDDPRALRAWSDANREAYWELAVRRLAIRLRRPYDRLLDTSSGVERARWMVGAEFNIAESCFQADPRSTAILEHREDGGERTISVGELDVLSSRVAGSLADAGIRPGDAVGLVLPMTVESVAAYLGVLKAGAVAVGIAESFSAREIGVRLRMADTRLVLTQDRVSRGGKAHHLLARVREATGSRIGIVVLREGASDSRRRSGDPPRPGERDWPAFLGERAAPTMIRNADDTMQILFSSGTTGEPKALPWTHVSPIKCASDAHFHQDVRPGDVVAWPTSLGWMMGPWLIFASLINRATIGLFAGSPLDARFGQFVERARVTMLGVVPSLVASWKTSGAMDARDWSSIRTLSSTGECSRPDDMIWLSRRAGGKPVIEYCGGTEISGGYFASVVASPIRPSTFNSPALGLGIVILDASNRPADKGELFLVPPSIGFSTSLLHRDHHDVYHAGCPQGPRGETLRRHGDEVERLPTGDYRALGRVDDTMNLGGIKVSSVEIERVVGKVEGIREAAAIAEPPPGGGPNRLVIVAVLDDPATPLGMLLARMRDRVRAELNPLFKIDEVRPVDSLPRTASNKVMRRRLRDRS